jgi:hypothetical protein
VSQGMGEHAHWFAPEPSTEKHALIESLRAQIEELRNQLAELQRVVALQRDEIAWLKGGPGTSEYQAKQAERHGARKPSGNHRREKNLPRGSTRSKVTINEEQIVKVAAPPSGSRFKGYTSCVVQDLVIRPHVVNFQCERWLAPDAQVITDQPALTVTLDRNCLASRSSNTMRRRPRCHGC